MTIRESIEAAKKAVSFRRESAEQEQARLALEVSILQRFEQLQAALAEHKQAVAGLRRYLDEQCEGNFVPSIALAISNNSPHVVAQMASELAARECIKRHKTEIVEEYQRITVDSQEAALAEFIKENSNILKRHGAI